MARKMASLVKDFGSRAIIRCGWSEQVLIVVTSLACMMSLLEIAHLNWLTGRTLQFFRSNLLGATADEGEERQDGAKASIIALQEFWLHHEYTAIFDKEFFSLGYELHYLQRFV